MQSDRKDVVTGLKRAGFPNSDLSSGSVMRRAYLGVEGLAFKDFWYEFRLNFGGTDHEAQETTELNIARVAYIGIPHFRINAGVIQPVFTLGDTVSSGQLMFIERSDIINVAADNFGGTDSRKGVEFTFMKDGMFYNGDNLILSAAYTGARTNVSAANQGHGNGGDENSQVLGRAAFRFYSDDNSNFQFGLSGSRSLGTSGADPANTGTKDTIRLRDRPEIRIDGTRLVDTGIMGNGQAAGIQGLSSATMYGADLAGNYKNFYLGGEYHKYEIDLKTTPTAAARGANPHFSGWYVEGSWIITGERKEFTKSGNNNEIGSWGAPKVVKPFSPAGNSWGVWELAARYSSLNLNYNPTLSAANGGIAGGRENILTLGVNWYLNQNIRFMLNDLIINVEKSGAAGGGAGAPLANNYGGQNLNVIAARLQFQM
jgi:phosphate-selective porin OprO/OprP